MHYRYLLSIILCASPSSEKLRMRKWSVHFWLGNSLVIFELQCTYLMLVGLTLLDSLVDICSDPCISSVLVNPGAWFAPSVRKVFIIDTLSCIKWGCATWWCWLGKGISWCASFFKSPGTDRYYIFAALLFCQLCAAANFVEQLLILPACLNSLLS